MGEVNAHPAKPIPTNATYWNPVVPDARMAQKTDKPFRLYCLASMAVDTHFHVITHMQADLARSVYAPVERDSTHLMPIVDKLASKLPKYGLPLKRVVADGGFACGLNCALLEAARIEAFVSLPGSYRPLREGFSYNATHDQYLCAQARRCTSMPFAWKPVIPTATTSLKFLIVKSVL